MFVKPNISPPKPKTDSPTEKKSARAPRSFSAMGTVGMAMSVAPAIGPTIGGLQTDANGWRSIFLTLTITGIVGLLLAVFGLRNFAERDRGARADFFSVGLSVFGFGGLMFGFTNIESYRFDHPMVWLPMAVGVVGIVWFVLRQIRSAKRYHEEMARVTGAAAGADGAGAGVAADRLVTNATAGAGTVTGAAHGDGRGAGSASTATSAKLPQPPLLDLGVLRNRSFTIGTICASLSFFAFSSILVIIPLYIQTDRGYSATMSGLIMLPGALGQCISQFFGGRLLDRLGARPVALTGAIVLTFGTLMMSFLGTDTWIWWISIWQFVRQIGMGFVLMPITTWSLNCLERKDVSAGSAVTNTVRQISGAVGAPVLVILMESFAKARHAALGGGAGTTAVASIFGVTWALRISAAIMLAMTLCVVFGVHGDGAGNARGIARRAIARMHVVHPGRVAK